MRLTQIILLLVCFNLGMAFVILVRFLLTDLESQTLQATEEVMVDSSKRFAQLVEARLEDGHELCHDLCLSVFPHASSELTSKIEIYKLLKKDVGLHYYITDTSGYVIYDSNNDERVGGNYSHFNDVIRTLRGEYGARSTRVDENDPNSSILYVGAPIMQGKEVSGVLTLYKAQSDVTPFINRRRKQILMVCVFMGTGTVLFVSIVFFWVYRPIGRLTRYAEGVIVGNRPPFPRLGKGREINTLGQALKKMRETLEGRDYAKNYVQTLSHELKSPISAIRATAELLQEEVPPDLRKRFLQNIVSQVDRSERAISRLQQLSQIEKMTELERKEKVRVNGVIERLVREYYDLANEKEVVMRCSLVECIYHGDPFLLRAGFQNLIDNAIKYSPKGGEVTLSLKRHEDHVCVRVSNEGEAIPEYARERIFETLFSLAGEEEGKGSGIGLALVKEAATLHQGEINYQYEKGKNVFSFILPR